MQQHLMQDILDKEAGRRYSENKGWDEAVSFVESFPNATEAYIKEKIREVTSSDQYYSIHL